MLSSWRAKVVDMRFGSNREVHAEHVPPWRPLPCFIIERQAKHFLEPSHRRRSKCKSPVPGLSAEVTLTDQHQQPDRRS